MRVGINGLLLAQGATYRRTGVSRYIESLLASLLPVGQGDELVAYVDRAVEDLGPHIRIQPAPISVRKPAVRIGWELVGLPLRARRDALDIFHGTVNVVPPLMGCPAVVTIHDLAFLRFPEQVTDKRYHYLNYIVGKSARGAAAVIVPSMATGEDVAELLQVPPDRIAVVPLGVSPRFQPAANDEIDRMRQKHGLFKPYVLAVGTIEPRKNLPRLIQAMARIQHDVEEDLVLAGPSGWLTEEVELTISRAQLGDRIKRPGYIDDVDLVPLYSAASVVAMPSLYEGFGLPVLEAMATGAPVVTSCVSSLPEVAGDAAVLIDPTSVESIADGLKCVILDSELRAGLRDAAIRRASLFTWERTARETFAVYRSVGNG